MWNKFEILGKKGQINEQDPYGWFQWYFRYWKGGKSEDDLDLFATVRSFIQPSKIRYSRPILF